MNYRRQSGYFHVQEDLFKGNVQGINKNLLEVSLLMKFL